MSLEERTAKAQWPAEHKVDDPEDQSTAPSAAEERTGVDVSCVVTDDGVENLTPLQIWSKLLKKLNVLEDVETRMNEASNTGDDQAQLIRDEAFALQEALGAIHKLASKEVRDELVRFYHNTLSQQCQLNMKIGHMPELLNSFDADYWALTQTRLFYRGDCREAPLRGRSGPKFHVSCGLQRLGTVERFCRYGREHSKTEGADAWRLSPRRPQPFVPERCRDDRQHYPQGFLECSSCSG